MKSMTAHFPIVSGADLPAAAAAIVRRAWGTFDAWHARHAQRRVLAELPPELLRDIGVTAREAAAEANKPFWRA